MKDRHFAARIALALVIIAILATCDNDSPVGPRPDLLMAGTWGGDRAGMVVTDTVVHVHINCTYGDFPAPITLDEDGRFSVTGSYLLKAYPVAIGPTMPALFAGMLSGNELTITIVVADTIETTLIGLGPVIVRLGREPEMGPCPICRVPGDRRSVALLNP